MYGSKLINVRQKQSKNKTKITTKKELIVVHWAGCTGDACVRWFLCPGCRTSAHYVINRFGEITQMVSEKHIAWHAGYSKLKDYPTTLRGKDWESLNVCSLGIEVGGPPKWLRDHGHHEWPVGWPEDMIKALIALCKDIATRHPGIKITDHSTIAPGRKYDVKTGKGIDLFPWERLLKESGLEEA